MVADKNKLQNNMHGLSFLMTNQKQKYFLSACGRKKKVCVCMRVLREFMVWKKQHVYSPDVGDGMLSLGGMREISCSELEKSAGTRPGCALRTRKPLKDPEQGWDRLRFAF